MSFFPFRPKNLVVKTIWIVFHAMLLIWTCFAVCLIGLFLLPLRFYNIRLYQILESQMWRIGAKMALLVSNIYGDIKFHISGDGYSPQEGLKGRQLIISSHVSSADWFIHLFMAGRNNTGALRFFLKSVLKNIPILGWCCYLHECIFLERDLKLDQEIIKNTLRGFIKNNSENWLILYAEGTYCTPNSHWLIEKTQEYSRKNNLPVLKNVLMPRTTGFELIMETREAFDYVTDVTIAYDKPYQVQVGKYMPPNMLDMFIYKDDAPINIHLHYRSWKVSDLPKEKKELSSWLVNLYREKDEILEKFDKVGKFPNSWVCKDNFADIALHWWGVVIGHFVTGYFFYQLFPKIFVASVIFNGLSALLVVAYDLHQQNSGFRVSKGENEENK